MYVGSTQSQFPLPLFQKEPACKLLPLKALHNGSRSVGRAVVNNQDVKILLQGKDGPDN